MQKQELYKQARAEIEESIYERNFKSVEITYVRVELSLYATLEVSRLETIDINRLFNRNWNVIGVEPVGAHTCAVKIKKVV